MKKALTILFLFTSTVYGQGLFEFFKLTADDDNAERFDRIVVDINFNNWITAPADIKQQPYSVGISAYWFKDIPLGEKSNVAFAYGLGVDHHSVHSNGKIEYDVDADGNTFTNMVPFDLPGGLTINKTVFNYLEVPVELRFRTMNRSREERMGFNFRLYLGFKGGWMMGNHTKYRDDNSKVKVYRLENTMPYRYGPTVRIGFNKIAFNAFYSLTPLFEKGKGVEVVPFSIGISWMRF